MRTIQKTTINNGFTLVELLIVIAVIGILSGIIYVSYTGVVTSSRSNSAVATAKVLQRKIEAYASVTNSYPSESASASTYTAQLNSYGDSAIGSAQIAIGAPVYANGTTTVEVSQCQTSPGSAYRIRYLDYGTKALSTTTIIGSLGGTACTSWKVLS